MSVIIIRLARSPMSSISAFLWTCLKTIQKRMWISCKEQDTLPFPMSMKELAKLGATTRETVNQVLKKLREEGVIDYEHKKLTFKNKDYFMRYFEGS